MQKGGVIQNHARQAVYFVSGSTESYADDEKYLSRGTWGHLR